MQDIFSSIFCTMVGVLFLYFAHSSIETGRIIFFLGFVMAYFMISIFLILEK